MYFGLHPNCSGLPIFIAVMADNSFVSERGIRIEISACQTQSIVTGEICGKVLGIGMSNGKDQECSTALTRDEALKLLEILTVELRKYEGMQP